jgi:nitrogen regulatory protein P-II 1
MKLILAIIRPEKLSAVQSALEKQDADLISVSQVLGDGREPGDTEIYRGREVHVRRPKLRLEIVTDDLLADGVVEAVARAAAPGSAWQSGDGQVLVLPVETSVRACAGGPEPAANDVSRARRWAASLLRR